ncbi:15-hydroxyprostaglandin dehydrogenase [NAD(+)]-like [Battus philenor]|uniref:15-hydroxyprostaglandin dehydrogenase [NAD(+)]-like n=1 Tax=Battus philenor TaxID=42288 RepID=UPI0035D06A15
MLYDLSDKVVLITGAATGIGARVVRLALDEGAKHVAVLDIADEAGIALQDELNSKHGNNKVSFIKCDVSNTEQLLSAFDKVKNEFGYIDVVVNNAGILNDDLKIYAKQIQINVTALVTSSLKALELMRKDQGGKGGTVINVASVAAIITIPFHPIYSATKSAVIKFSTAMGSDVYYSRTGVRFISICFGPTDTPLMSTEKMGSFDTQVQNELLALLAAPTSWQRPETAAIGVIEAFKKGTSGSMWIVNGGNPAADVTDLYNKSFEVYDPYLRN